MFIDPKLIIKTHQQPYDALSGEKLKIFTPVAAVWQCHHQQRQPPGKSRGSAQSTSSQ